MARKQMDPEEEALYAINFGVARRDLPPEAQAAYDRIWSEREARGGTFTSIRIEGEPRKFRRSSPETRARILEMFKRANRKYALPFQRDRLAVASFFGGDWEEYGQIVLQMAILDTLLSIEEKLDRLPASDPEAGPDTDR